jgi:hypothetical protein
LLPLSNRCKLRLRKSAGDEGQTGEHPMEATVQVRQRGTLTLPAELLVNLREQRERYNEERYAAGRPE